MSGSIVLCVRGFRLLSKSDEREDVASFISKEVYNDLQCRYIQVADMLKRIVADYRRSDEDARGVSAMESPD